MRRHARLRKKVSGTAQRPRLVVTRSARHIVAQLVDDVAGHTLASASTLEADVRTAEGDKKTKSAQVGTLLAGRPARPGSLRWCSTGVATCTTAASRRWPTPPARAA